MKLQAPTSNIQRSSKLQAPINERGDLRSVGFGVWNLEFLWSLELGAWNF
jgi:hypothetical protein